MFHRKLSLGLLSLLLLLLGAHPRSADQTLIAAGSLWRYSDTGSNLGTAWRAVAYNDAGWPVGQAQLGYGDGDESTVLSYGSNPNNRRITYYFRRGFTVSSPSSLAALTVRFVRDDGCVIYVNGVEVVRSNMPAGTVSYTTRATSAVGGADESAWLESSIDPSLLVTGTNVIAVELHQSSPTSADISFDLELLATEAQVAAPVVTLIAPADRGVANTAAVTFTASATAAAGLASATLYVGGPAQTVTFSGALQVEDAQITADTPTVPGGTGPEINVDGQTPHAHGLLKFPSLIGSGSGRVPAGAIISSAVVRLNCTNTGSALRLYRLTQDWIEDEATWNERSIGSAWGSAGADGAGSNAGVSLTGDCAATGPRLIDITRFVQEWSNGAPNYGLVLTDSGTDGVDFSSSESASSPVLSVTYKSSQQAVATHPLSGTSAQLAFSATLLIGQTYLWNVQVTDGAGRQSWAPLDFELTVDASLPDEPVPVSPVNGSIGVPASPLLTAFVSDPGGGPLNASVALRRAAGPEFTIVVLPDTQHYSEAFPAIFTSQTQWIVDSKEARNIVFVTHEGDVVEHYNLISEYQAADFSLSKLDGIVPYGVLPGNHDQPTTLYNQFFPYTRYQGQPWYGGHFQNLNNNNYQLFSGGGMDFVIVHMEFCPSSAAVTWADSVFKAHPDRIGIMTTHGYLNESAQRTVHGCSNTQYLWDGLAVPNPNLHFMLSGHVHDESRRTDTANGHPVFQMLADFQDRPSGGEGWLRILRFVPAEDKVYVQTYSPWLNRFETDANSEFTLDFPMGGAFGGAGAVTVPSGSTASITPAGLAPYTRYEWRVTATNGSGQSRTGPVWSFTTGAGGALNEPPAAADQSVSVQEDTTLAITLTASDPEGSPLTYTIVSGPSHGSLSGTPPTLIYQPAANYNGADGFTFRASDGQAIGNTAAVSITVQAVNDAPTTSDIVNQTIVVNTSTGALGFTIGDLETAGASLVVSGTSSNPALVPPGNLVFGGSGAARTVTITPAAGQSGTATITVTVSDGALTGSDTLLLTVTGGVPPPTYLLSEGFEGTGFESTGWTRNGTPNPDYTSTVLHGAQSLNAAGAQYIWRTFQNSTSFSLYTQVRAIAWGSFTNLVYWDNASWGTAATVWTDGSRLHVTHGSASAIGTATLSTNTTYHVWVEWTKGTGTNGTMKVFVATTGTKPAAPDVSLAAGTGAATQRLYVGPTGAGPNLIFDRILIANTVIGTNP